MTEQQKTLLRLIHEADQRGLNLSLASNLESKETKMETKLETKMDGNEIDQIFTKLLIEVERITEQRISEGIEDEDELPFPDYYKNWEAKQKLCKRNAELIDVLFNVARELRHCKQMVESVLGIHPEPNGRHVFSRIPGEDVPF